MINVVAALIIKNNKILFAKRAKGNLVGKWEFPGGKKEKGETSFKAIEREIKEELGLEVVAQRSLGTFKHQYNFGLVKIELILCQIKDDGSKVSLDGSHSEVQFFNHKNLKIELAPLDQKIFESLVF